jgi:hypothetical protein
MRSLARRQTLIPHNKKKIPDPNPNSGHGEKITKHSEKNNALNSSILISGKSAHMLLAKSTDHGDFLSMSQLHAWCHDVFESVRESATEIGKGAKEEANMT